MRRTAPLRTALAALLLLPVAAPALAQRADDDWQVTRDPFDREVIARYKAILAKNPHDAGALAKLLSMYRRYRTVELLQSEYEKQLDKQPSSHPTLTVLGYLRKAAGDEAGALAYFERAAAAKADDATLQVELGALYRNAGKAADAAAAYDRALAATKSKDVQKKALRALADLALSAGDVEAARAHFERYIALEPKNTLLRIELGDALLQHNRHDDAIAAYRDAEKAIGNDPTRKIDVILRIGQALEGKGDDAEAIAEYRRAHKMVPRGHYVEIEVIARIVDIHRRKQDLPALLAQLEKEWATSRRGHFEWATLAQLYEETGAQDKAIEAYYKAVGKAAWELDTQRRLIQLLENVGREDDAIKQYEAVVRVAPSEARFQLELAERYERRGDLKKALAALKKLEQSFPSDPGVQSALADLYQRWGKDDLALAAYERLARLEPDDPSHLVVLGEQYWQKGDKANRDKALTIWKRIANAKTAAAYAKLGDVLAEHGMHVDGLAHYAKALKLEPKNPDLYRGRATIYESQKQWAEALADWETTISLLGDRPQDRTARREARRHIVILLTRWGGKEAEYRNKWLRDFRADPPSVEAGFYLVEYYDRRPQAGEPKATLEKLRKLVPEDQDVISELVKAYRNAREYDKAVALLLELEALAPHRKREIYTQIAEIKTDAKQDDDAIEWAKKAVEISGSKDPVAWERLAERYAAMIRKEDVENAIAAYEKALELDRRNFRAAFALAGLYIQSSRPADAAALYRRILRDATDDETLVKAGDAAIALEEMTGTLGELDRVVAPLTFQMAHKPVYRRILVKLFLTYVPRLQAQLRHGDAAARQAARAELDRLGQHGLKPMLEALNDDRETPEQRSKIAETLGQLGNPGAAPPLVKLARTEPKSDEAPRKIGTLQQTLDWEARVVALVAAGRLGNPGVLADVLPLARHDEVAMREAAVFTIGRTRDRRAVAPLVAALEDGRESVVALACLGLAGAPDDARAADAMAAIVADGKRHDHARAACAWSLGVRKAKGAIAALTVALGDNRGEAQRLAAWALGQIGDARPLPELIRAYFTRGATRAAERGTDARAVIAWAIARVAGAAPAAPPDADLSDYPMLNGKFHTASAIARLPGTLPPLGDAAAAVIGQERAIADGLRAALGEHRDAVLATLADLDLRDDGLSLGALVPPGAKVDAKLAAALAAIGQAIAPDVLRRLDDRDPKVRAVALSVAAKLGAGASGIDDAILRGLADRAGIVREAAMGAIATTARLRGATPRPLAAALAAHLRDARDYGDRRAAARTLGALGADADTGALIAAVADDNSYVRTEAARSLGALRARGAVDALLEATRDPYAEVREAAAAALVAIGDPKARARLGELAAGDPDERVRAAAAP